MVARDITGVICLFVAGVLVFLGYSISRRYFRDNEGARIGAIDALFTLRGIARVILQMAFYILWFGLPFSLFVLGVGLLY
jgi:hypothetical protein